MAIYENGMAPITESVGYEESNIGKSFHNLSRVHQCQGIIGAEMPIDVIKTIPDDTFTDLEYYVNIVSRNPLSRDLRNSITVAVHAYWSPCSELWEGWNNYITKGRSGTENLEVPKYFPYFENQNSGDNWFTTFVPCSPSDYMGVPIAQYDNTIKNKNYVFKADRVNQEKKVNNIWSPEYPQKGKWEINALPLVMYNKIHRDYYMNQNLMQNNKNWFPTNDKDFILPYNNTYKINSEVYNNYVNVIGKNALELTYCDDHNQYYCDVTDKCKPYLNKLHFRQFRGDYFTTASPFPDLIRGNPNDIDEIIGTFDEFKYDDQVRILFEGLQENINGLTATVNKVDDEAKLTTQSNFDIRLEKSLYRNLNNALHYKPGVLNKLRKAIVLEKMMMRNGATNGTYREIIGAQFGYKPNQFDGKPRYLGGGTFNINFNSVIMQGSDTTTQNTGDKVSIAEGNGIIKIPKFHADDFGYIMIIATIIPDVYYNRQGLETMWTTIHQDQEYFPIKNNLAPRPILNKELWLGTEEENNDVFGYAEYASDLRSRQNIATGLCAVDDKSIWDSSTIMHRKFNAKPELNNKMITMYPNNIDLTPFYDANEIPFDMLIGCKVGAMRKIPYSSKPADLGIKY